MSNSVSPMLRTPGISNSLIYIKSKDKRFKDLRIPKLVNNQILYIAFDWDTFIFASMISKEINLCLFQNDPLRFDLKSLSGNSLLLICSDFNIGRAWRFLKYARISGIQSVSIKTIETSLINIFSIKM